MASAQTGIAVVFGIPGGVAFTGVGTFFNESAELSADHSVEEVRDEDNDVRSLVHSGEMLEGTLTFTPRAATGTNTKANAALSLGKPTKGSTVTLSAFASALLNSAQWVYCGGFRLAFRKDGVASYTMRIRRSLDYDLSPVVG